MPLRGLLGSALGALALVAAGWTISVPARAEPRDVDLGAIIARVGERLAAYYQRAQQLVCVERSTVIPIGSNFGMADGFARTVESELRLELDAVESALFGARVTRDVRRINGRAPRDRDRTDRSGCTDPTSISPEPLAFLLPGKREQYLFTSVRDGRERERAALVIEFASARSKGNPQLVEDEFGHDDCFDWKGPVAITGRVWIDAATYDVLKLEQSLAGPTDVRVPWPLQRKYSFTPWLTLDRDDLTLRYKEVTFTDPEEKVLLPDSIESMTVFRNGLQSIRRTQTFTDYRRFLTHGRIKAR